MRFSLAATLLAAATTACARSTPSPSSSHQTHPHPHPVVVYLHPAPHDSASPEGDHVRAPLLTSEQAQAVLAHHLEGSSGKDGEEYENLAGGEAEWAHLASGEAMRVQQGDKAKVVIIQADVKLSEILPGTIPSDQPSFYLPWNHDSHDLLKPYMTRARHVVGHLVDALPEGMGRLIGDVWDLSTSKAASLLSKQLTALTALAERLPWTDRSHVVSHAWESIMITALGETEVDVKGEFGKHVQQGEGLEEEARVEGCKGVKAALEAMTTGEDQPPLAIIFLPSDLPQFHYKVPTGKRSWLPSMPVVAAQSSQNALSPRFTLDDDNDADPEEPETEPEKEKVAGTCYPSNRTCALGTSTCSGHGSCVWSGNSSESLTGECWSCKCSSGYLGVQCQKGDYVFQTILLIFTPLLILVVILMSVGLLSSVGGEKLPSTLNVSVGVPSKRD